MKRWYVDRVHESSTTTCTGCGHLLAFVDMVGWVDTDGDSYDMCPGDPYGNHAPRSPVPAGSR